MQEIIRIIGQDNASKLLTLDSTMTVQDNGTSSGIVRDEHKRGILGDKTLIGGILIVVKIVYKMVQSTAPAAGL